MRGERTKILLLVVVGLVIVGGLIVIPSLSFSWGVEEGDVFVFHVTFTTQFPEGWKQSPIISAFNDSQISVSISYLPLIISVLNGGTFITNIVNPNKITCVLENGTEVNDEALDLLSKCILPIGGWDLIDSYFPKDVDINQKVNGYYFTEYGSEYFLFGYRKLISDDTSTSWFGYINLETGIPLNVTQRYFDLSYVEDIVFTLVDS